MPDPTDRLIKRLTPAMRSAVKNAQFGHLIGGFFLGPRVSMDTRARLMEAGLLGKRSYVLTLKGERVREKLNG